MLWAHHHQYLNDNLPSRMAESWWVGWTWTFLDVTDYIQYTLFKAQIIEAVVYSLFDYLIRRRHTVAKNKWTTPVPHKHIRPQTTWLIKPRYWVAIMILWAGKEHWKNDQLIWPIARESCFDSFVRTQQILQEWNEIKSLPSLADATVLYENRTKLLSLQLVPKKVRGFVYESLISWSLCFQSFFKECIKNAFAQVWYIIFYKARWVFTIQPHFLLSAAFFFQLPFLSFHQTAFYPRSHPGVFWRGLALPDSL